MTEVDESCEAARLAGRLNGITIDCEDKPCHRGVYMPFSL